MLVPSRVASLSIPHSWHPRTFRRIVNRERQPHGTDGAVTGPTGDIGISAVRALERIPGVERIIGMARRPFYPAEHGWARTEYQQGDILDRDAVDALVAEADVVVHLAFIIMGSSEESARVNLEGHPQRL